MRTRRKYGMQALAIGIAPPGQAHGRGPKARVRPTDKGAPGERAGHSSHDNSLSPRLLGLAIVGPLPGP